MICKPAEMCYVILKYLSYYVKKLHNIAQLFNLNSVVFGNGGCIYFLYASSWGTYIHSLTVIACFIFLASFDISNLIFSMHPGNVVFKYVCK